MKNVRLYKLVLCALLSALALITFTIESLFPPIILPGARLGLSNVFILLCLILLGVPYAFSALVIKTIIGSLFAGNISMILYSLPAGAIALSIEIIILYFVKKSSIVSVSVAGAILNSALQNLTFCIVTGFIEYLSYLPYLTLIAIPSGVLIGFIVYLIAKRLPQKLVINTTKQVTSIEKDGNL